MGGGLPRPADRPMPRYQPEPEDPLRPVAVAWPPVPDYPAVPPYLAVRDRAPGPEWPPGPTMGRLRTARAAVLGYLTVPVFVVPLVIYLSTLRKPGAARRHAAQAVNVWVTGALYDLAAVIMGAMLALDSPRAALLVFAPLIAARWLVTLRHLIRAARAATRGAPYTFPAWLCMRVAR